MIDSSSEKVKPAWQFFRKSKTTYETAVGTMEEPLIRLVDQLKDKFKTGEYFLLIGDDASGRLPALVLKRVANYISDRNGVQRPDMRFIRGGRFDTYERYVKEVDLASQVAVLLETVKARPTNKRALLVTEFISGGRIAKRIASELNQRGIRMDVATLDMLTSRDRYREYGIPEDVKIYSGLEKHIEPPIQQHRELTGLLSQRWRSQQDVAAARKDVKKLSDKIIASL